MIKKYAFVMLLAAAFTLPTPVQADESCDQPCPDGKVKSSFADGNNASCVCLDEGAGMQPTNEEEINCDNPDDDGDC